MERLRDKLAAINLHENPEAVMHFKGILSKEKFQELRFANVASSAVIVNSALAEGQLVYKSHFFVLWKNFFRVPVLKIQLF